MKSPYSQGFGACMEGKTINENPFAPMTTEHSEWQEGWRAQDEHLNAREDALTDIGYRGPPF